jgi:hypothetical protein
MASRVGAFHPGQLHPSNQALCGFRAASNRPVSENVKLDLEKFKRA